MSNSEDVKALFRRFGGNASAYQEIVSQDQAGQAEQKWPMLRQINPAHHQEAPSVQRASPADSGVRQSQETVPFLAPVSPPPAVPAPVAVTATVPVPALAVKSRLLAARGGPNEEAGATGAFAFRDAAASPPATERGGFLSAKALPGKQPEAEVPAAPAASRRGGLFGRRAEPEVAPRRGIADRLFGARAAPSPAVTGPARAPAPAQVAVAAAQPAKVGRRKAVAAVAAPAERVASPLQQPARRNPGSLGQVFSSKLSPQPAVNDGLDVDALPAGTKAVGLGQLFERMATPAPAAAPASAKPVAGRKKALKW